MSAFQKAKSILKKWFDLIANEKLKLNLLNALPYWISALLAGGIAVLYASLFNYAEAGARWAFEKSNWILFIVTPLAFIISLWIVGKYAPFARGSGIPQVTAAIEMANPKQYSLIDRLLSLRIIFVKICTSLIVAIGGGVIGREGPTIQISASVFKKINDWLPAWYPKISKRNMIITGSAAGLAAAFNTPLGGIVFAIEELTKTHFSFFKSALLTGVIIAGLTAAALLGPYLYLGYPRLNDISVFTILTIFPLAIITAIAGSGMGKAILALFRIKKNWKKKYANYFYALACGLLLAAIAVFIDFRVLGSGKNLIVTSLFTSDKHVDWYVPLLRIIGPIISFSTGCAGGIFAPSLSAGASIGGVFANWFELTANETNLIILCGMTGCLTSITRSPFTSSILILEMTDSHSVIFYIMLTALISNLFASLVTRHSFYDYLKVQYFDELKQVAPVSAGDPEETDPDEIKSIS